jgi:pseudomonalisin
MDRMLLLLEPDAAQQNTLDALLEAQQDPSSPEYHQWLSPETFGQRFGASERDVERIVDWLAGHGFEVEPVAGARRQIVFSGTAAQVQSAFHTEVHLYNINGEPHYANASDPEIPQAIAEVVSGVVSLHNFRSQPIHKTTTRAEGLAPAPEFTTGGNHYLTPADFGIVYDVAALYSQSIDGTGQSIAVVGRTDLNLSDVQKFRSQFGLPPKNPTIIVNGADPGIVSSDEQMEATLDVEWSGAVAKNAAIQFVMSASTNSSDGVTLSAQYIVNHNLAPIVTLSFGSCEAVMGTAGNQFWNALWQQAAAQGMTVLVSSGDSGAAGCDDPSNPQGYNVRNVNGLCSSPYSTCVGGTQFADTSNPNAYWSTTSDPATWASALSYIPETVWNASGTVAGGSGLWASGGGASQVYAKPSWQTGPGVPSDGWRDVPDVSLNSAIHDGCLIALNGQYYVVAGTSVAAPSFAGLLALALQKTGARQGNVNPTLYSLAAKQASGGPSVFHDIATGNNSVPGVAGFNAGVGYDLATGLGSVDAMVLVNHWSDAAVPTPGFQVSGNLSAVSLVQGSSARITLSTTLSGGFSSAIAFSIASLPLGLTASFSPSSIAAPGSGSVTLKLSATQTLAASTYNLTINASGGGVSRTIPLAVTITPALQAGFSLGATSASFPAAGGTGNVAVSANLANAQWTAISNVNWIAIGKGASGSGTQTVTYTVAPNTASAARSGTLTIAGLIFTVNQAATAASCSYRIALGPVTSTLKGASGSVAVSTASGCQWTASSTAPWLTVSSGSTGNGNGTVSFFAATNTIATSRSAVLTVAGYAIQVTEAAARTVQR